MLVARAEECPGLTVARGASVKDLLLERGRVVGVRVRSATGERQLHADLVVGADGRASVVRKRLGVGVRRSDQPMDIVWCKLPCPAGWAGARGYIGRGHLLVAYHTWDGSLQLGWVILKGTFGELRSRGITQWVEEMAHHVSPDFAAHLRAHADAARDPFLLDAVSECVHRWSAPGALLIGDAAHTMSPVGGQGINIALRDAIVAANHLVPVLAPGDPDPTRVDAAAQAIEAERMPEVETIQRLQARPPRIVLARAWWGEPLRRLIGALLRRSVVRARLAGGIDPFAFGVTDVRIEV
jgi:2-polyprenyl-6-methoxyphenol hydroxylase-like FAD-dependent oxidoreductase